MDQFKTSFDGKFIINVSTTYILRETIITEEMKKEQKNER